MFLPFTQRFHRHQSREAKWVGPTSPNAITDAFLSYLKSHQTGRVELATPFTSDTLSSESLTILSQLLELTSKGWWTVGSQPAVDGTPSNDAIVGWGPVGGWVYQKAFVEFFATEEDILRIENLIQSEGKGVVTFFAGDGAVS
jgi:methylenetetrahydrofolate reductase (NADPH)